MLVESDQYVCGSNTGDHGHLWLQVLAESRAECAAALRFLAEVKLAFPEVLQAIKTMQLAQEILLFKEDHIFNLAKTGSNANGELLGGSLCLEDRTHVL